MGGVHISSATWVEFISVQQHGWSSYQFSNMGGVHISSETWVEFISVQQQFQEVETPFYIK